MCAREGESKREGGREGGREINVCEAKLPRVRELDMARGPPT